MRLQKSFGNPQKGQNRPSKMKGRAPGNPEAFYGIESRSPAQEIAAKSACPISAFTQALGQMAPVLHIALTFDKVYLVRICWNGFSCRTKPN